MLRSAPGARALALAALLLALPALPGQAQDPGAEGPDDAARAASLVTLYAHVFSLGRGAPMPGNTQFPWGEDDFSAGTYLPCAADGAAGPLAAAIGLGCDDHPLSVLYLYSTAGFVDADPDGWSYEDFHNERGQAKDIHLDPAVDITAAMYMSSDAHPYPLCGGPLAPGVPFPIPCWNWDPGVQPDWQVEATLFLINLGEYQGQASEAPPVDEKVRSGDVVVVAQGVTEPQVLLSLDGNLPGAEGEVVEFALNLGKPQVEVIPKEMDWVLRFRWWSSTAGMRYQLPVSWNVNSGEFYPIRFTLPVRNAFDVELVYPQFLHGKLVVHAMMNSPWGSYDIDPASVTLAIADERGAPVEPQRLGRVADFSVAHGGHYKPVNVTWVWDHRADGLAPGLYTATVTAHNFQHSAASSTQAQFRIRADGTGETVSIGRSGQQTFTEAQLRAAEQAVEQEA